MYYSFVTQYGIHGTKKHYTVLKDFFVDHYTQYSYEQLHKKAGDSTFQDKLYLESAQIQRLLQLAHVDEPAKLLILFFDT